MLNEIFDLLDFNIDLKDGSYEVQTLTIHKFSYEEIAYLVHEDVHSKRNERYQEDDEDEVQNRNTARTNQEITSRFNV